MSYLQSILNKRLGIRENPRINESFEPKPLLKEEEKQPVEELKEIKTPEPIDQPVVEEPKVEEPKVEPKKNARGAGRKRITPAELERRKLKVEEKYKKQMKNKEIVEEIKENSSKDELKAEILIHKKKLQLLSDALDTI